MKMCEYCINRDVSVANDGVAVVRKLVETEECTLQ